jgi:hypothetical protein
MSQLPRHVHTIFCDDVRLEAGNKQTLVGTYGPSMTVESFPMTVPQLCVLVRVTTAADMPFKSLEINVSQNSKTLANFSVPSEQLDIQLKSVVPYFGEEGVDDEKSYIAIGAAFHFVPFQITEPGLIKVFVSADGVTLPAQGLKIAGPPLKLEPKVTEK